MMIFKLAGNYPLRPWLGDILKCPENGFQKGKMWTRFLARHGDC